MEMQPKNINVFIKDFILCLNMSLALCCDFTVGSKITSICEKTWDRKSDKLQTQVLPFINLRSTGRNNLLHSQDLYFIL